MTASGEGRIGILCATDQPVFSEVAERLREQGFSVWFFDPHSAVSPTQIDELTLLVNKQVFPVTLPALRYAHRTETPLWNSLTMTIAFSSRLVTLNALEAVGFRTPPLSLEKPAGEYVAKDAYVWDGEPELNGQGDFYQARIPADDVDYKYYAVDDGTRVHTAGRRVTSKLYGPKRYIGPAKPRPSITDRLRRLVERTDVRGLGVDFIKRSTDDTFWAVDLNLAAGFRNTGLETALCVSILSCLRESDRDG